MLQEVEPETERSIKHLAGYPRLGCAPSRASLSGVAGRVFNIQRFSLHDGPGIRTTVFLKGCPLSCTWCANPESQKGSIEISHSDALCDGCGRCVAACHANAISLSECGVSIDRGRCIECGTCVEKCLPKALRVIGEDLSVEQAFDEVMKDEIYYRHSDGGVTCSGGEPLVQARFVAALFARCRQAGIHTTVDTCGLASRRAVERVLAHTDLVLFDLKAINCERHRAITGMPNEQILENSRRVADSGVAMIVRVPLIPGLTDAEDNIRDIADFVRSLGRDDIAVNVLPYHRFGENKYRMLDRPYEHEALPALPDERIHEIVRRFESRQLACEIVA
ncbi:MAG: glycyl-radical enzyme activating protein [Pseudomonadales bacterium]|nr:glycyl-radical enzyme activating protein [Pseudomonadales bacterium]MBP8924636.1 glycyl-radical enzyme activating protein [Pseudomonadales bacterium]